MVANVFDSPAHGLNGLPKSGLIDAERL